MKITTKSIARTGIIAAMYAACSLILAPFSYGTIQFRVAEMLTLTPVLFPEGIVGVTIGCLIANAFSPIGVFDLIFGTLITLVAAVLTMLLRKRIWLAALPPIVLNAVFLPLIWYIFAGEAGYWLNFVSILISQSVVIGIAIPLAYRLKKDVFKDKEDNKDGIE